jgi:hypothetical protein
METGPAQDSRGPNVNAWYISPRQVDWNLRGASAPSWDDESGSSEIRDGRLSAPYRSTPFPKTAPLKVTEDGALLILVWAGWGASDTFRPSLTG